MEQCSRYAAQGELSKVCLLKRDIYGLKKIPVHALSSSAASLLHLASFHVFQIPQFMEVSKGDTIILIVYVHDILVTRNDKVGI